MFASMLEAADFGLLMAYPDKATSPSAGIILMLPRGTEGPSVDANWDVLGMRATRSDSLILDERWVPDSAAVLQSDECGFRHTFPPFPDLEPALRLGRECRQSRLHAGVSSPGCVSAVTVVSYLNWFWGSYSPIYLCVAQAAFDPRRRREVRDRQLN